LLRLTAGHAWYSAVCAPDFKYLVDIKVRTIILFKVVLVKSKSMALLRQGR